MMGAESNYVFLGQPQRLPLFGQLQLASRPPRVRGWCSDAFSLHPYARWRAIFRRPAAAMPNVEECASLPLGLAGLDALVALGALQPNTLIPTIGANRGSQPRETTRCYVSGSLRHL